jgi:hypothetical protein
MSIDELGTAALTPTYLLFSIGTVPKIGSDACGGLPALCIRSPRTYPRCTQQLGWMYRVVPIVVVALQCCPARPFAHSVHGPVPCIFLFCWPALATTHAPACHDAVEIEEHARHHGALHAQHRRHYSYEPSQSRPPPRRSMHAGRRRQRSIERKRTLRRARRLRRRRPAATGLNLALPLLHAQDLCRALTLTRATVQRARRRHGGPWRHAGRPVRRVHGRRIAEHARRGGAGWQTATPYRPAIKIDFCPGTADRCTVPTHAGGRGSRGAGGAPCFGKIFALVHFCASLLTIRLI